LGGGTHSIEAVLFDVGDTLFHASSSSPMAVLETAIRPVYDRLAADQFILLTFEAYMRVMRKQLLRAYVWSRIIRREFQMVHNIQRGHRRLGIKLGRAHVEELCRESIPAVGDTFAVDGDAMELVSGLHREGFKRGLVSKHDPSRLCDRRVLGARKPAGVFSGADIFVRGPVHEAEQADFPTRARAPSSFRAARRVRGRPR